MLRKIIIVLSFIGLLLSVGLWGASYFHVYITPNKGYAILLRTGCFRWVQQRGEGAIYGEPATIKKAEPVSNTEALRIFERELTHFRVFISDSLGLGIAWGGVGRSQNLLEALCHCNIPFGDEVVILLLPDGGGPKQRFHHIHSLVDSDRPIRSHLRCLICPPPPPTQTQEARTLPEMRIRPARIDGAVS